MHVYCGTFSVNTTCAVVVLDLQEGLSHGELLVECNMSCVGPICEILQGMEGGWVVIEASHMMGYGLNVTFNMLIFNYLHVHIFVEHAIMITSIICFTC